MVIKEVTILDADKTAAIEELVEKVAFPGEKDPMFLYIAKANKPGECQGKFWNYDQIANTCLGMDDEEFQDWEFALHVRVGMKFSKELNGQKTVFGQGACGVSVSSNRYGLGAQDIYIIKHSMLINVDDCLVAILVDRKKENMDKMPLFFFGIEKIFSKNEADYNGGSGKIILELTKAGYDQFKLMVDWGRLNIELNDERLANIQKVLSKRSSE